VHALLVDRVRYPSLLAQSNAGNIVFTAPDFQISSVGVKCMDDVDRHFHFGWIDMWREGEREATFHEDLCGEDELFMNELRRSGVHSLGIIHNSNKILSTVRWQFHNNIPLRSRVVRLVLGRLITTTFR